MSALGLQAPPERQLSRPAKRTIGLNVCFFGRVYVFTCSYVRLNFMKFACTCLAQILYMKIFELTPQQTCIVTCKKMPRPAVSGLHPRPLNFVRIRYRFFDAHGYWFSVQNRNAFEPQFVESLQFAGVIHIDLDGHTWAWYANDLSEDSFRDRWVWFPQGLHAHYFWPDGRPAHIPVPD